MGLEAVESVDAVAESVLERARRGRFGITFRGDAAYPARLGEVGDSPPLLFYRGPPCSTRRRVAMVGSRKTTRAQEAAAKTLAAEIGRQGVGVVSGAAEGIDTASHEGALLVGGETWAFVGSALDCLDPAVAVITGAMLEKAGTVYSEFPPGVHADRTTFPRRNRLISGASDAVLIVRAGEESGALITAACALDQGRPLLARPGEVDDDTAKGCNRLLRSGKARMCLELADVLATLGLGVTATPGIPQGPPVNWEEVSPAAREVYRGLAREPTLFEQVMTETRLSSGALASALCELELLGLVIQRPGKRYEKT